MKKKLTPDNLKNDLYETFAMMKAKKMDPSVGNACASLSREIMRVISTETKVSTLAGLKPSDKLMEFIGK